MQIVLMRYNMSLKKIESEAPDDRVLRSLFCRRNSHRVGSGWACIAFATVLFTTFHSAGGHSVTLYLRPAGQQTVKPSAEVGGTEAGNSQQVENASAVGASCLEDRRSREKSRYIRRRHVRPKDRRVRIRALPWEIPISVLPDVSASHHESVPCASNILNF